MKNKIRENTGRRTEEIRILEVDLRVRGARERCWTTRMSDRFGGL